MLSSANGGARLITQDDNGKANLTVGKAFYVKISPKPFEQHFNLFITGSPEQPATVRVLDVHGRIAEQHQKVTVNSNLLLGNQLQGSKRKMVKVIKQ
jgi:hypothetical protein